MNEVYNRTIDRLNGKRIDIVTLTHMRSGHDDNSKYYMKRIVMSEDKIFGSCERRNVRISGKRSNYMHLIDA